MKGPHIWVVEREWCERCERFHEDEPEARMCAQSAEASDNPLADEDESR